MSIKNKNLKVGKSPFGKNLGWEVSSWESAGWEMSGWETAGWEKSAHPGIQASIVYVHEQSCHFGGRLMSTFKRD